MELQWPLILFTTFLAWSAGLFGSQCLCVLKQQSAKAQLPALITSAALLAIGGIAVFFHLQHWERIFNGFGNPTSGITQELVAIVLIGIAMVLFFVMLRRGEMPKWTPIVGVALSVVLLIVMAHSYMMAARPAWDNVVWIAYVMGNACILGPATFAVIAKVCPTDSDAEAEGMGDHKPQYVMQMFIGGIINMLTTIAYTIMLALAPSNYVDMGYFWDPSLPMRDISTSVNGVNAFAGDTLMMIIVSLIGAAVALAAGFMAKKNPPVWAVVAIVAALVGAITMRVAFYMMGISLFMYF